jgi:Kdo2-lipid IVA lauroyltransferase/acyltransferase
MMTNDNPVGTGYRLALRFFEMIPLTLRAFIFEGLMMLVWAADGKHRRIARVNLRIAFPEMDDRTASRIIRRCYVQMGTSAAEFIHLPKMDKSYVEKHFRIEGAHHFVEAKAKTGLGPLGLTGHFGNWELLSHAYAVLVEPLAFIVRPLANPSLDRIVQDRREFSGSHVIRKFDSAKAVLKEIRRGVLVGILIDQNVDTMNGVLVDFFSKKAYTTFGLARLALATRTTVHSAFIFRDPERKFHHILRFGPPLPMDPEAPREEEVERLTRACNLELEKAIRMAPDQWLWFHRRWKTRPPGEPNPYEGC